MSTALVPVKPLAVGKSRLGRALSRSQLEALSLAMLRDVVTALGATPSVSTTAVVTPDDTVARAAEKAGALALRIATPGLNPSLEAGARALALDDDEALLVVLGDVAAALPEELEVLHARASTLGPRSVVLAPSSDGGTCALLRTPHDVIPPHFGADSAARHGEAARAAGVPLEPVALPSLALDLDDPDDIERFLAAGRGGAATRGLLRELAWGQPGGPSAARASA